MERIDFLSMFHPVSEADYQLLSSALKPKNFKKGSLLTIPGQVQKEVYFVRSGVQMSYYDTDQRRHVIAFTYPPNLCAIPESFQSQVPSTYYLQCYTDSHMDAISFDALQDLFDRSQGIERLFRKMTEAVLAGMINRHIELHAHTIEQRFTSFCQRSPHLLQLVPHKYIASYLGIDPTNFSKLYNTVKF